MICSYLSKLEKSLKRPKSADTECDEFSDISAEIWEQAAKDTDLLIPRFAISNCRSSL